MIRAESVEVLAGRRALLGGVSLQVGPGEVLALFGPNGAGKSTLLRVLAGLQNPTRGEVWVGGQPLAGGPPSARGRIGYLGHASLLYPLLTGEENLRFYASLYGLTGARQAERVRSLLARVGLEWSAMDLVRTYSRGMLQRLAIARAWLARPDVLLLDEPHTGLDPDASAALESLIAEARAAGSAVVLVAHGVEDALRVATRVAVLDGGVLALDRPARGLSPAAWADAYRAAVRPPSRR